MVLAFNLWIITIIKEKKNYHCDQHRSLRANKDNKQHPNECAKNQKEKREEQENYEKKNGFTCVGRTFFCCF